MQRYGVAEVKGKLSKVNLYLEQYGYFYRLITVKIHCRIFFNLLLSFKLSINRVIPLIDTPRK
jgi:hypothetical protein